MYVYAGLGKADLWAYDFGSGSWSLLLAAPPSESAAHPGTRNGEMKSGAERLCCAPEFWLRAESGVRAEPGAKRQWVKAKYVHRRLSWLGLAAIGTSIFNFKLQHIKVIMSVG